MTLLERIGAGGEAPAAGSMPSIFASHPPIPDRVENVRRTIADVLPARDTHVLTTPEFEDIRRRVAGLPNAGQ